MSLLMITKHFVLSSSQHLTKRKFIVLLSILANTFCQEIQSRYYKVIVLTLSYGGGEAMGPHVVFLLYLLNSLFLRAEIFRLFLKFYGESFGIQFELVRQKSPDKVGNSYCFTDTYL